MPVLLTPGAKASLLQQSVKVGHGRVFIPTCFPKVLLMNREFVDLARRHSVYRFTMTIYISRVEFCFQDVTGKRTRYFSLSLEQAYKWIKLLDPPIFNVVARINEIRDYFCLLGCVNGKLCLDTGMARTGITRTGLIDLIKFVWFQISELICTAKLLAGRDGFGALPLKQFDFLSVSGIKSMDELKRSLKQKATRLFLGIDATDRFVKKKAHMEEAFINEAIEQCEVESWADKDSIFSAICVIVKTCPNLKRLVVQCRFAEDDSSATVRSAIEHMAGTNVFIEQTIEELKKRKSIDCAIAVYLKLFGGESENKYPRDCLETFRRYINFKPVEEETEHRPNGRIRTKFAIGYKDQQVSVSYNITTMYKYLEDDH